MIMQTRLSNKTIVAFILRIFSFFVECLSSQIIQKCGYCANYLDGVMNLKTTQNRKWQNGYDIFHLIANR